GEPPRRGVGGGRQHRQGRQVVEERGQCRLAGRGRVQVAQLDVGGGDGRAGRRRGVEQGHLEVDPELELRAARGQVEPLPQRQTRRHVRLGRDERLPGRGERRALR